MTRMSYFCSLTGKLLLLAIVLLTTLTSASARGRDQPLNEATITVGSELDYPPFAIVDKNGKADGFSVDLIKAVAGEVGLKLRFVVGPWDEMKGKLERGEIDALPLVAWSVERAKHFDYSVPHTVSHAVIFIRKDATGFRSHEDFRNKEVIVMQGDSTHEYVISRQITDKLTLTTSLPDAFKLLASGKHDFVIAPKLSGLLILNELGINNIKTFGEPLDTYGKGYAFAVHKGDAGLLSELDRGLVLAKASGAYSRIYDKWFGRIDPAHGRYEETIHNVSIVAVLLGLFVLTSLVWNFLLRRKVAQRTAALRESEQRFRDVSDAAGEYVWEINAKMIYTYVSGRSADVKGYKPEELLGHTPMEFMPEEDIRTVADIINKAIADKAPFSLQHRSITPAGDTCWEEVHGVPFYDDTGMVIGLRGTGMNITERIEAERILRNSEATFRAMADNLPLAIYASRGIDQVCEYVNPGFEHLFGYTQSDVPSVADWWPLAYPDEGYRRQLTDTWQNRVKQAIATQTDIEPMETVVSCKDGSTKNISWGFITLGESNYAFGLDLTEHKQAEKKLVEDEQRFRALFQSAADYALVLEFRDDAPPVIVDANEAAFIKHGYSRKEMIGQPVTLIDSPSSFGNVAERIAMIEKGDVVHFEVEHVCKDGTTFFAEAAAQLIEGPESRLCFAIERDITDRKDAERKILESENRFSATFSQAAIGMALIGLDGSWLRVNQRLADMLGYCSDELMRLTFQDITHPDDLEKDLTLVRQMLDKIIDTYSMEKRYFHKSGHIVWVNLTVSLVFKDNGEPDYFISAIANISQRKAAEEKVSKLSQAVEQSGEAVVITDSHGLIEYVNPAFSAITGYTEEEVLGNNPRILNSGNQSSAFYKEMWESLTGGNPWHGKVVNKKKDGSFYPAMLTISPIKDANGNITSFIGLQQDLQKHEMLEAQFHQAQKMEAIGTLVGGIAHNFNNDLAGITGNLYLARRAIADHPDVVDRLKNVERISFGAAATIQQLLTFSRNDVVKMHPFSIASYLKETFKMHRASLPENIDLQLVVNDSGMRVNGDIN